MISVALADDHAIVRSALRSYLADFVDLRVVGEASNGNEAIDLVRRTDPKVLVMDLFMPGKNGMDAMGVIRLNSPRVSVLILSGYAEEHYALNLLQLGASGYLSKDCDPVKIVDAIRTVSLGHLYFSPEVADLSAKQLKRLDVSDPHKHLSPREFQVLLKLAQGGKNSDVADALCLSVKSVSTYRSRLMEKLGLKTNSDLTYYALVHSLIN